MLLWTRVGDSCALVGMLRLERSMAETSAPGTSINVLSRPSAGFHNVDEYAA